MRMLREALDEEDLQTLRDALSEEDSCAEPIPSDGEVISETERLITSLNFRLAVGTWARQVVIDPHNYRAHAKAAIGLLMAYSYQAEALSVSEANALLTLKSLSMD